MYICVPSVVMRTSVRTIQTHGTPREEYSSSLAMSTEVQAKDNRVETSVKKDDNPSNGQYELSFCFAKRQS